MSGDVALGAAGALVVMGGLPRLLAFAAALLLPAAAVVVGDRLLGRGDRQWTPRQRAPRQRASRGIPRDARGGLRRG